MCEFRILKMVWRKFESVINWLLRCVVHLCRKLRCLVKLGWKRLILISFFSGRSALVFPSEKGTRYDLIQFTAMMYGLHKEGCLWACNTIFTHSVTVKGVMAHYVVLIHTSAVIKFIILTSMHFTNSPRVTSCTPRKYSCFHNFEGVWSGVIYALSSGCAKNAVLGVLLTILHWEKIFL